MKKILQSALLLLAFLPAFVCAQEKTEKKSEWAELKAFHSYMSTSFHPAEEGNFAPLKEKAEALFQAARTWQKSTIPDDFKPEETKKALKELVFKCSAVNKAVKANATDEQLKKLITEAHDVFHTIVGECRRSEG